MPLTPLSSDVMDTIVAGQHGDPFAVLGPHPGGDGTVGVRAFLPAARAAAVVTPDGAITPLRRAHPGGLWEGQLPGRRSLPLAYRLRLVDDQGRVTEIEDPYRFSPTLSGYDLHLLGEGTHFRLFERLGAHPLRHEDVDGVRFAVWAPNARRVSVVGDWNGWDGRTQPMRLHPGNGIWEIFLPGRPAGRPLQVRDRRAGRRAARAEVGPAGLRLRAGRSAHRLRGRRHQRVRVGRRGVDGRAQAAQRAPPPHVGLRGAPGLVAAPRARHAPELSGAGRAARRLRERDGLHPRRAPAGHRAPVLRLLGLPDPRLLRADPPLRHPRRLHGVRGHAPPPRHRGDHGLGARPTSPRTPTGSPSSTAPTSTSTTIRTCATTPTGAPACSTTAAARSPTS